MQSRILTASADQTAKLWDAASGKLIAPLDHQDAVDDAAFSPDGARILTASADQTAKFWDATSEKLVASFEHQACVYRGAFSPDGLSDPDSEWTIPASSGMRPRAS